MVRLESDLERETVRWAEARGGKALKLKDEERGWPDRTVILPGGLIGFAELKRPDRSKRYHMQTLRVAWLQSMGFPAAFCTNLDEVGALFDE